MTLNLKLARYTAAFEKKNSKNGTQIEIYGVLTPIPLFAVILTVGAFMLACANEPFHWNFFSYWTFALLEPPMASFSLTLSRRAIAFCVTSTTQQTGQAEKRGSKICLFAQH